LTTFAWKIVVLGDQGVGKTSLISRFVNNSFKERYSETVGTDLFQKVITIDQDNMMNLMIWDLGGQDYWKKIRNKFYQQSRGGFIVYDVTNPETMDNINEWYKEAMESISYDIPFIILANKSDLDSNITDNMFNRFKKTVKFPIVFTSAKMGENVDIAFEKLTRMMIKQFKK
jgi:small GTP-binding protein